jgi:predicted flap endonuclease-1-like 5' DNA nuclease
VDAATAASRPAIGSGRDNLQRVGGITPEIEKLLNVQGVTRYSQIAHWSKPEIERFDRLLGHQGRIGRENWIEQAQILAKGGDTAHSREYDRRQTDAAKPADAPRPSRLADAIRTNQGRADPPSQRSSDLASLRSVRSEAFQPPAAATTASGAAVAGSAGVVRSVRSTVPDDLKRIRGIGVLIEKKLNSMGTTNYEQIANWTAADIDRVSRALDFKGRIERENWVEQARILAAGGQTEFSRRTDRGDWDTRS